MRRSTKLEMLRLGRRGRGRRGLFGCEKGGEEGDGQR